jgi:hypothetical protein
MVVGLLTARRPLITASSERCLRSASALVGAGCAAVLGAAAALVRAGIRSWLHAAGTVLVQRIDEHWGDER